MALINKIKNKLFPNTNTPINYLEKDIGLFLKIITTTPEPSFIRDWSTSCLASCHVLLKKIFTEKQNYFSKNKININEEEVNMLIKMIVMNHYITFINNFSISLLKKINLRKKDFEDAVFYLFSFNNEDKKIFKKLNKQYGKNPSKFLPMIYEQIRIKLNIKTKDPDFLIYFINGLMGSYKAFNHGLIKAIKTN